MKVNRMFNHIPSSFEQAVLDDSNNQHHYITPKNDKYPSVTGMLSKTKPEKNKNSINTWRNLIGPAVADYIFEEARIIGNESHKLNENYHNNLQKKDNFRLISHAHHRNFIPFLNKVDNIRGLEIRLYSDSMKMGGSADCIAEYDGVLSVIDYKTKRSPQAESWMDDYFIQTCAYASMWEELTNEPVKQLVVLASSEKNTIQEFIKKSVDYINPLKARLAKYYN